MKKIVLLAAAVAMLAAMAVPASATEIGVFQGDAKVGVTGPCTSPSGNGIFLPGLGLDSKAYWQLTTVVQGTLNGPLNACGELGQIKGVNPACGISSGSKGTGTFAGRDLYDLGWTTSAGGTLPVTGHWSDASGNSGSVVALVQAQGGQECAPPPVGGGNGATSFTVAGVAVLI